MAVAHVTSSQSHASASFSVSQASFSWTHTTSTDPQGVLVLVFQGVSATDAATSVTYDGTTIPAVSGGLATDTATEPGSVKAFFLGAGVPTTNNPTVVVNRTNNTTSMWAVCVTVTAASATEIVGIVLTQENGAIAEQSVNDGSTGVDSLRYAGVYYGGAAPAPAGTNSTLLGTTNDAGAYGWTAVRETTAGQGARSVGCTQATSDDRAGVHLAIREVYVPPGPQITVFESARDTTSPKTVVVTGAVTGDVLYVHAGGDAFGPTNAVTAASAATTAGSTGSWTELAESLSSASEDWCGLYKATVTADGSVTVQISRTQAGSAGTWHFWVQKVAAGTSDGENVHTKFTVDATEVINFAVAQDSAVSFASYDWDAVTPGTFTPAGSTEVERAVDANYGEASAYWLAQSAGTRDYGTTGSASTNIKAVALEILAASAVTGAAIGSFGFTATAQGTVTGAVPGQAVAAFGFTATGNGVPRTPGVATAAFGFTASAIGTGPQKFITSTAGTGTAAHFVDQSSDPILIRGYVLWGLLMNAGRWNAGDWQQDLEDAVAGLQAMGCNVLYTEPLGNTQNGGAFNNGNTHDGVAPFTSTSPVTFNTTFWARSDYLFDLCEAAGITVFFNWAYSDDLDTAALAGFNSTQFGQYGTELGNRYKTRPNLVWMMGGDYFDTFASQVATVKSSIRATGDTHLFGVQNYPETTSRKDIENNSTQTTGTNSSEFNFVYSYNAIYWGIEYAWTEASPLPVLWGDGHFDADTTADRKLMRDLTWWTFSSGGRGMIFGSEGTWAWGSGALANLTSDTFPNTDMDGIQSLFASFTNWHQLVPDTDSSFVTAGRGTKSDYVTSSGGGGGEYNSSDTQSGYVTASITADGTLAVVYFPVDQTITVNDTELNAGYTATWVDPISGATSSATIASTYSPTGNNSLGGPDWLLVFEASAAAVTGQAVGTFGFTGSVLGVDRSVGAAGGVLGFTAVASGVDRAVGAAVAVFGFTATSVGVARAVGAAGAAFGFTATAVGEIGTPPVAGQATAAFGFTATAQGIDRAAGAALAALGFTATASGAVGTPPVTGTALATFGFTGGASGAPRTGGVATASFGFTATASGVDRAVGAAAAAFGFVGAASGIDRAVGAANAAFGFTAAAAGVPEVFAVAVALFGFTATTQGFAGTPPVTGVAAALFGFAATTQGQPRTPGVAVGSFGFTGISDGRRRVVTSAAAGFGFTAAGVGVRGLHGVAQAMLGFAALAAGQGATVSADSTAAVRANVTSTPAVTVVATSSATVTG